MPRRFDKRDWNRQFKWQPLRVDRWDPFPKDHLPFIDDFSAGATLSKIEAAINKNGKRPLPGDDTARKRPRTRSEVEAERAARRAYMRSLQHGADPFGSPDRYSWHKGDTRMAMMAAAAPFAPLAFPLLMEDGALITRASERRAKKYLARLPKKRFIRGKLPDALRKWTKRAVKAYRLQKKFRTSNKTGYRIARRVAKRAWKYA